MKIIVLSLFFFMLQQATAQNFKGFICGGLSTSQVSGDDLGGFDKAGVTIGGGVAVKIAKATQASFEITYIQKGSRQPSRLDKGDPSYYRLRLNYLEMPLTARYEITDKISILAGVAVGLLLGSHEENENGEFTYGIPFKDQDIGCTAGVIYKTGDHLGFGLKFIQSLIPIREYGGNRLPFFSGGQYNSAITATLEYYLIKEKNDN